MRSRLIFFGSLAAIMLIGVALRLPNLSPYLVYPDSYTGLVVADNIMRSGTSVAPLGREGMVYPDFLGWTRPGYSSLVAAVHALGAPLVPAGRGVAFTAGLLCIPAAGWLLYEITRRRAGAVIGAAVMALSFGSVVWGGFALTESTSNLILLILFAWTVRTRRRPVSALDPPDYLTGALLAGATLTRYEYLLLTPLILLASGPRPWPSIRWANLSGAAAVILILATIILRPLGPDVIYSLSQLQAFIPLIGLGFLATLATIAAIRYLNLSQRNTRLISLAVLGTGLVLLAIWAPAFYPGLMSFARDDGLITRAAVLGLILMIFRHSSRLAGWALLAGLVVLAAAYFKVNPTMARYGSHLLPLLIIPATFLILAAWDLRPKYRLPAVALIVIIAAYQGWHSLQALHADQDNLWYTEGYEEVAARRAAPDISKNTVIFAALPEPWYLATHRPTQSFTTEPPYIYAPDLKPSTKVTVVADQALKEVFPKVFAKLQYPPGSTTIKALFVTEPFRYRTSVNTNPEPAIIYDTTLGELQSSLKQ